MDHSPESAGDVGTGTRMRLDNTLVIGIAAASLASGPIAFLVFYIMECCTDIANGRSAWGDLDAMLGLLPLVVSYGVIIGFVVSLVPNAVGSFVLGLLGTVLPEARFWPIWPVIGGAIGFLLAVQFNYSGDGEMSLALTTTGAACAAICRHFTQWVSE